MNFTDVRVLGNNRFKGSALADLTHIRTDVTVSNQVVAQIFLRERNVVAHATFVFVISILPYVLEMYA